MFVKSTNKKVLKLRRNLKVRHLSVITMGSSLGTGLFIASNTIISIAGPVGSIFTYILIGLMVYFLMTSLGELTAYMPVSGSFSTYGQKYVEEGFGFALGWNYWYNWAITISVDLVAVQLVMHWWFPNIPGWIWSILFLVVIFFLNFISIHGFDESEYWFSLIKIATVTVFNIVGLTIVAGLLKSKKIDLLNWNVWKVNGILFSGNIPAMISIAMIVGFSFQGIELIGIIAGESKNPDQNVPRVVRKIFCHILFFYILTISIISLIVPYTKQDCFKNNTQDINVSPFTLVFQYIGFLPAAEIMNAVMLTSVLSAVNSGMYASTHMIYALACDGKAPKFFSKLTRNGIPRNALYATAIVSGLCLLTFMFGKTKVYLWLLNTSSTTGFIAWIGIAISHYRFRRGYVLQGNDIGHLPYRSRLFPFGPIFIFVLCMIIILGQNCKIIFSETINWCDIISSHISILLFSLVWFIYKLKKRTHFVRYNEMQFPICFKNNE